MKLVNIIVGILFIFIFIPFEDYFVVFNGHLYYVKESFNADGELKNVLYINNDNEISPLNRIRAKFNIVSHLQMNMPKPLPFLKISTKVPIALTAIDFRCYSKSILVYERSSSNLRCQNTLTQLHLRDGTYYRIDASDSIKGRVMNGLTEVSFTCNPNDNFSCRTTDITFTDTDLVFLNLIIKKFCGKPDQITTQLLTPYLISKINRLPTPTLHLVGSCLKGNRQSEFLNAINYLISNREAYSW